MASPAMALDDAEMRGKQIYFEGTSPRGTESTAVVGDEAALLPGRPVTRFSKLWD